MTLVLLLGAAAAHAEEPAAESTDTPSASAPLSMWEGAIGVQLGWRPEYSGASRWIAKATPVIFLRYGRFTVSNGGGFRTRRADDVMRGLGVDLVQNPRWRVNLALRVDNGRSEGTSAALAGLGDIKPTVRARATAGYSFGGPWRLGMSWSADAFGRGGGNYGDVSLGWESAVGASSRLSLGASLAMAQDRYMQTYYGITPEQSARTGYPVYEPSSGLRDFSLSAGLRTDFCTEWTLITTASATHLLGPAARSPLTTQRNSWGLGAGLAWRF